MFTAFLVSITRMCTRMWNNCGLVASCEINRVSIPPTKSSSSPGVDRYEIQTCTRRVEETILLRSLVMFYDASGCDDYCCCCTDVNLIWWCSGDVFPEYSFSVAHHVSCRLSNKSLECQVKLLKATAFRSPNSPHRSRLCRKW